MVVEALTVIIKHYTDGKSISYISNLLDLTEDEVLAHLRLYKSESVQKLGNSYNDELKKIIAKRDRNEVSRSRIAKELELSSSFVGSACKKFGDNLKKKSKFSNQYTELKQPHGMETCPNCKSHKVNEIDDYIDNRKVDAIYCMCCGLEHFKFDEGISIYRLNYEFDEE